MIVNFHSVGLYDWLLMLAAFVILLIAVARINDIKPSQNSKRWWARRIGLLMVFVSMTMFIAAYFTVTAPYWDSTRRFIMLFGWMLTWITTPDQPPFWKYISKNDAKE